MSTSIVHLGRQLPSIWASLALVLMGRGRGLTAPGPVLRASLSPRARGLVAAYQRYTGADWGGALPPHLFPQWCWPLLVRAIRGAPYDFKKAVNAGCAWTSHQPIPLDAPLRARAWLDRVDDDGRRALLSVCFVTGTEAAPDALESEITVFVPLKRWDKGDRRPPERPRVPIDATRLLERRLGPGAGADFAVLTGDPNPIHWSYPYARLSGFSSCILHGFAQAAIAADALVSSRLCGDSRRLTHLSARFVRPLPLPSTATVYQRGGELYLGTVPGAPAYLTGAWNG